MERNRVFGGKCYESLASYDRESSSWKMSQLCFFEEDVKSLDRLPKSGTAQNGQLYPLEILELRICAGDGLQLPTPTASEPGKIEIDKSRIDPKKGINQRFYTRNGTHTQKSLSRLAHWGLLPTPTASDPDKHSTGGLHRLIVKGSKYSAGDHRNLPTPTATDAKNNPCTPSRHTGKHAKCINTVIGQTEEAQQLGRKARLSPLFVEWMMGFPIGWTDLER